MDEAPGRLPEVQRVGRCAGKENTGSVCGLVVVVYPGKLWMERVGRWVRTRSA